jgi:hypothetical protein
MLQKVLAWSALGLALLFVILSFTVMFAGGSLGATGLMVVPVLAIVVLVISILLSVATLVMSLVQ